MELEKNRGNAGSRRKLQIIIKILTDIREDISSLQQEKDSIKKTTVREQKQLTEFKIWKIRQTFKSIVEREGSGNLQESRNKIQRNAD